MGELCSEKQWEIGVFHDLQCDSGRPICSRKCFQIQVGPTEGLESLALPLFHYACFSPYCLSWIFQWIRIIITMRNANTFPIIIYLFMWRPGFTMQPRMSWNSLCKPGSVSLLAHLTYTDFPLAPSTWLALYPSPLRLPFHALFDPLASACLSGCPKFHHVCPSTWLPALYYYQSAVRQWQNISLATLVSEGCPTCMCFGQVWKEKHL